MAAPGDTYVVSDREKWRREYRQGRKRRSLLISIGSTLLVAVVLWLGVTHAPGWSDAKATFFSWDSIRHDSPDILRGLLIDLEILAVAAPCSVLLALMVAIMRTRLTE